MIPEVVTSLSSEHVLVTEYVEGLGFEQVKELPQAERDRFGEIVFRFFLGSLYRTRRFSADPHPGNYLLLPDGRVAFLDFGMAKRISREQVEAELAVMRAGIDRDAERLRAALAAMGFFDPTDELIAAEAVQEHFEAAAGWYAVDREFTIDRDYVRQVMIDVSAPALALLGVDAAPDDAARRRCSRAGWRVSRSRCSASSRRPRTGTGSRASGCSATRPPTPLGEAEAEFFGRVSA